MSRRKAAPTVPSHPDSLKDTALSFGYGVNPLTQYRQERDFFRRRRMVYEFALRCTATACIADSVGDEIASQEIYVTPTEANPSASTLLVAQRSVDLINRSMFKRDGFVDFIKIFVESYWFSKTGAFILLPRDGARIQGVGILNPMIPFPYFGWEKDFGGRDVPRVTPKVDTGGHPVYQIEGIWFTDGSVYSANYFTLTPDQYHQVAPGATGWGAFLDTRPRAEAQLPAILACTALVENLLDTVLCTDSSQAIIWDNVDPAVLKAYSNKVKEIRAKRRQGETINPEDEGMRLHVTAREPDKPANAKAVNFRAFPEGFDVIQLLSMLQQEIALGFGVHPRRAAPDTQKERFGNAQQAAMLNSDEPGVRAIKQSLSAFYSGVLMGGQPLRAEFMAKNSPENYAQVMRDQAVAQTVAQLRAGNAPVLTDEQAQRYLLRQGLLEPADAGVPSMRTGDAAAKASPEAAGPASLRWPDGTRVHLASAITVPPRRLALKADGFDVEACTLEATARYEDWMVNELPDVVDHNGIGRHALEEEVDDLAVQIYGWLVACAKSQVGNVRGAEGRSALEVIRESWYNAFGSPRLRANALHLPKPDRNLFNALWGLSGKAVMELGANPDNPGAAVQAVVGRMQQAAAAYTSYIPRYFNSLRTLWNVKAVSGHDGPVRWVRFAEESCGDCVRFEGTYPSLPVMLRRTGGLAPGDLRLTCSGNCKCQLQKVIQQP